MIRKTYLKMIASAACLMLGQQVAFAAETFTFDPSHSYLLFKISHFGFSEQTGKWYLNGKMTLDKDKPENSSVTATVKINDLVTGLPELDKHLKDKLFFDVKKYPQATFTSDKVEMTGDKTAKVYGKLTLHGVTKPVILDVVLNKEGVNPINEKNSVGFKATTMLKRSEYGMTSFLPGLGDDVSINIDVEANQPKKAGDDHAN